MPSRMSSVEADFDRLALLDDEGWTANNQYHNSLLKYVPVDCENALEIGCGTGAFARVLAKRCKRVVAIDLSAEMIRVARARLDQHKNLEFELADAMKWKFPQSHFDFVCSIATLHHLDQRELLLKIRDSLKPRGVLVVLDLSSIEQFGRTDLRCCRTWREWRFAVNSQWAIAASGRGSQGVGAARQT